MLPLWCSSVSPVVSFEQICTSQGQWQQPPMYQPPPRPIPPFQAPPPPRPLKKKPNPWFILGIIFGVVILCSVIGNAISKTSPTSTNTTVATDTPIPTDTPAPTAT